MLYLCIMQLEVLIYGNIGQGVSYWGYKNLFSGKIYTGIERAGGAKRMELLALTKALDYFLYGTHKNCTIYVSSSKVLNEVHDPDKYYLSKDRDLLEVVQFKLSRLQESGKTINILKPKEDKGVKLIEKNFLNLKNGAKRTKKKNYRKR